MPDVATVVGKYVFITLFPIKTSFSNSTQCLVHNGFIFFFGTKL